MKKFNKNRKCESTQKKCLQEENMNMNGNHMKSYVFMNGNHKHNQIIVKKRKHI